MNISIDSIDSIQDEFLLALKKGNEIWLTEKRLNLILSSIFIGHEIIHNKNLKIQDSIFRPDYRIPSKNLIVEFQGYQHYTTCASAYNDIRKRKLYQSIGYNLIEIPYFIQLTSVVTDFLFNTCIDFSNSYPHGFIHPLCKFPGDFCKIGLDQYKKILSDFPEEVELSCNRSLEVRSNKNKIPLSILNP